MAETIHAYNGQHRHRGLPKHELGPAEGKRMTPDEAWAHMLQPELQVMLGTAQLRHLFMPCEARTPQRGEVRFLNQHYFSPELMQVDGEQVRVHYDIHDGSRVWVWTRDGRFICEALHTAAPGSNGMPYFPVSAVEAARNRRVQGIVKRREAQIDTALRELQGTLPAPRAEFQMPAMQPPGDMVFVERVQPEPARAAGGRPLAFDSASDRYEWLMQHRQAEGFTAEDMAWLAAYAASAEYQGLQDYYASRGLAWPDDPHTVFKTAG